MHEKNPRLWAVLGNCLVLFCTPIAFYTLICSTRIYSSLKVGDLNRVDKYVRKIKTCYKITGILYIMFFVLIILSQSL